MGDQADMMNSDLTKDVLEFKHPVVWEALVKKAVDSLGEKVYGNPNRLSDDQREGLESDVRTIMDAIGLKEESFFNHVLVKEEVRYATEWWAVDEWTEEEPLTELVTFPHPGGDHDTAVTLPHVVNPGDTLYVVGLPEGTVPPPGWVKTKDGFMKRIPED